jgi:peptidoglycan/LPS O-acetylase OafA/YrhL
VGRQELEAPGGQSHTPVDSRLLDSGQQAGTAPGDRRYRPDVDGLRALAITLVVLYHYAVVPQLTGAFVGVDVFFVISGFVITGLLLREREGTGRTSILDFYSRRCRRILPAATLVLVATVLATYVFVGPALGNAAAVDGRWTAVFLANLHAALPGANPLSPLATYWSLSVEEQFYLVFPALFLLVARSRGPGTLRTRMAVGLGLAIAASYSLSIVQTASHSYWAFLSPFTRAWELAVGALIAVGTSWLKRIPTKLATALTWLGLGIFLYAVFTFTFTARYPGSIVAIPVIGAALIIAGGVSAPRFGAEFLLGLQPCRWLGQRSYSLYLWHWPVLIIAGQLAASGTLLTFRLPMILFALGLSMVTYRFVENPIRHSRWSSKLSVTLGVTLIAATVLLLSLLLVLEA